MKTSKEANAVKTLIESFSSAVKISKVKSITVEKRILFSGYDVIITPSERTNIEWLADTLHEDISQFAPLVAFHNDGVIIIS